MTPDLDWNETNTLVMQFLASTTAAMRRKPMPPPPSASTNTMSSLFDYGHLLPACSVGSGDTNATTYGSAANAQNYLAVFPSTVAESTFNGPSSNAGTTGSCNNMGQKMEEATDRVGHEESSNDATALEETERNSRDGEPSVPGGNPRSAATNHNASAWTNLSVDESVLSNLAPLSGNPLLNIPHLGFHPSSAAIQEELMAHARIEHRLRVQILRMQKRAWHLKLEWLERRRTRSRQSDGGSEVAASTSLNAVSANAAAADAPLQNGTNGSGGAGGDGWAGDMVGDEEEEDDEDEDEDEEEDL